MYEVRKVPPNSKSGADRASRYLYPDYGFTYVDSGNLSEKRDTCGVN